MHTSTLSNNQLLPPEVAVNSGTWFGRARSYPIFSPAWYRYRSLAVLAGSALAIVILAAMISVPLVQAPPVNIDWFTVAMVAGLIAAPYCTLCLVGPALAVAVRRLGLRGPIEGAAILLALLAGMALSAGLLYMLVTAYERPRFDFSRDMVVTRALPTINFRVHVNAGQTKMFLGQRGISSVPPATPQMRDAQREVDDAAAAARLAQNAPVPPVAGDAGNPFTGAAAQLAIEEMKKLDAGDASIDPARRAEIEKNYAATIEKQNAYLESLLVAARAAPSKLPETPRQAAAFKGLVAAMEQPRATAPSVTMGHPWSKRVGSIAALLIGVSAMLLAGWLGGLFDLVAFLRQRGKLVDVLQKEELQRAQAARNSAEMRLSVLAAQVEPHFLFNTLASVRSAITSDPQRATQIVDHMVNFLRSTIPQMRDDAASASVTLASQLDSARSYLALMHARIGRLQFSVEAEPGLENAAMPPLMLISLVENAVKHGVEPKIGPARITVSARRIDAPQAQLEVCVSDDGVGFGEAASGGGIGLANIQERLRSYYGQRASLTLKALPDGGVAAILRLPLSFES